MTTTGHLSSDARRAGHAPGCSGMRVEPPSREDLALLQGVACAGTLKGAAKAARTTQPAASRRLCRLERRVGAPLIRSDEHGLRLTEGGWGLLQAGNRLLMALGSALSLVSQTPGRPSGPLPMLRIAAFGSEWSELIDDIAVKVPGMLLSLVSAEPETSVEFFERYSVDAAYVWEPPDFTRQCTRPSRSEVVLEEPLWMALPMNHPLAAGETVSIADFANDEWLVRANEHARALLAEGARRAEFEPRIAHVTEVASEMRGLLGHGKGVSLASPLTRPPGSHGFVLKPLAERLCRKYVLLTDPTVVSDKLSAVLCSRLRDCYLNRAARRNPAYVASPMFPLPANSSDDDEADLELFSGLAVAVPLGEPETPQDALAPDDLHLLRVVDECGSLNRAAPVLLITQPALTRRILRLERRLGLRLLLRGHRGTVLTATARRLLDGASEAETRFEAMLASIHRGERAARVRSVS
ncbi:LysR family transcriptional regulator [Amycolatopsis sp. NPDC004079]|uniref:LysR family transcriptional regulator n=1 Tax=Amycolatopsis sp. NPDC004079 TaxID=3154549 RepID=UPI0033BDB2A0